MTIGTQKAYAPARQLTVADIALIQSVATHFRALDDLFERLAHLEIIARDETDELQREHDALVQAMDFLAGLVAPYGLTAAMLQRDVPQSCTLTELIQVAMRGGAR